MADAIELCIGYPTRQQQARALTRRLDDQQEEPVHGQRREARSAKNLAQMIYVRKFDSDFAHEMNRSARAMLQTWVGG